MKRLASRLTWWHRLPHKSTARSASELDRTLADLRAIHDRVIAIRADVTDRMAVDDMVAQTETRLGPIDSLVNNAGIAGVIGPIWETDPDDWWREVEVNLRGPLLCARALLPGMIARRRGRAAEGKSVLRGNRERAINRANTTRSPDLLHTS